MNEDYNFYADTPSGHAIKVLVEVFQRCVLNDGYFNLDKDGIHFCCTDNKKTTLLNSRLHMREFDNYHCETPKTVAINLKHFHKLLKNVKKKDSITMFINKDMPNKLGITLVPIIVKEKSERAETSFITIREVSNGEIDVPDGYHFPKVIPSNEYQKMCKKMAVVPGKTIRITIQENKFISFFCDGGDIISSEMAFGTKEKDTDTYVGEFYTTTLDQLIKMPGLAPKMQISAPHDNRYPLKIRMNVGTLGFVEVFLKTKNQIEYEESKRDV